MKASGEFASLVPCSLIWVRPQFQWGVFAISFWTGQWRVSMSGLLYSYGGFMLHVFGCGLSNGKTITKYQCIISTFTPYRLILECFPNALMVFDSRDPLSSFQDTYSYPTTYVWFPVDKPNLALVSHCKNCKKPQMRHSAKEKYIPARTFRRT